MSVSPELAGGIAFLQETARILMAADMRQAALVTLWLSAVASLGAILIGMVAAFSRLSSFKPLRWLAIGYIEIFRNTPLLIQLLFWYSGLQSVGVTLAPELCGIVGLSLYTGAFLAEIFRAGVLAVSAQQRDAGLALGLTPLQVYLRVLLPQAARMSLPAVGNQLASLLKNSSLLAFITVEEAFYMVYRGAVEEFRPAPYFLAGRRSMWRQRCWFRV